MDIFSLSCIFVVTTQSYSMMMGEIGSDTRYDGIIMAQILYILYAFFVVILLSNVLIAIVTDSYEFIQNDRAAIVFWTNRLDFVAETDGMSSIILGCFGCGPSSSKGAAGAPTRVQERPGGTTILDGDDDDEIENQEIMYHIWASVTGLFTDTHYYEDEKKSLMNIEFWVFAAYQCFALFVVIPIWIVLGIVTVGILWPPQVRQYMLIQETGQLSQQSRERQKLEQLREIQGNIAELRAEIQKEIEADRSDMARMKLDVENNQAEVLSDLQQIKELMTTLLDLGGAM